MAELVSIFVSSAASSPMTTLASAALQAGVGIVGDRYAQAAGTFAKGQAKGHVTPDKQVTLVSEEAFIAATREHQLPLSPHDLRRNLLVRGVDLNAWVGHTFAVGDVVLRGIDLCEPCRHLEKLTGERVIRAFLGRGGLRAEVVLGGTIHVGNAVTLQPTAHTPG